MAKFSNMLKMLFLLQKNEKMTINELANELEVSEKQVRRYKTELEISGIYIKSLPGVNGGYYLDDKLDIPININVKDNLEYLKYFDEEIRDELALELVPENSYQVDKLVKYLSINTADQIIYDTLLDNDFSRNIFVDEFLNIVDCVSSEVADKLAVKMFAQGCTEYEVLYPYISNHDIKNKLIEMIIYSKKVDNISIIYNDLNEKQKSKILKIIINSTSKDVVLKNKEYIRKTFFRDTILKKIYLSIKMNIASFSLFIMMLIGTFILVIFMFFSHISNNIPSNLLIADNVYPTVNQLGKLDLMYNDNLTFKINPPFNILDDVPNTRKTSCKGVVATNSNFIKNNIYKVNYYGFVVGEYSSINEKIELIEGEIWDKNTDENVAVIDTVIRDALEIKNLNEDHYIKLGDTDYLIIGIVNEPNESKNYYSNNENQTSCLCIERIFIPYKSYLKNVNVNDFDNGKLNTLIKIVKGDNITKKDVKYIEEIGGIKGEIGQEFIIQSHITQITSDYLNNFYLVVTVISLVMIFIYIICLIVFIKRRDKLFRNYKVLFNEEFNKRKFFTLYVLITGVIFGVLSYILNLIISYNLFYNYSIGYNIHYLSFITFSNLLIIDIVNISVVLVLTLFTYRFTKNNKLVKF